MAIWVLIILIIIGISFAVSLYLYDNSNFSKITGFSYFKLWTDSKIRYTYKLMKALHKAKGEHRILLKVKIPVNGYSVVIDAILLHESGIYVINQMQCGGWIYGREQDAEWAQALHKNQLNKFDNPVLSNKKMIFALKELLPEVERDVFLSLIVFTDNCSFNKIEIQSKNVDVIKTKELNHYWSWDMERKITIDQIEKIYNSLEKYMDFSSKTTSAPINNINNLG